MRQRIVIIVFLLLASNLFSLEKGKYWELISPVWENHNYAAGIKHCKRAIKEYPDEVRFYITLIFFYAGDKQFKKAYQYSLEVYELFNAAVELEDALVNAHSQYGWDLFNKKDLSEALAVFKSQYTKYPDNKWSLRNYGHLLMENGRSGMAIEVLEKGLALFPDMEEMRTSWVWAHWKEGEALVKKEKNELAYAHFKRAYSWGIQFYDYMSLNFFYKLIELEKYAEAEEVIASHPEIPADKLGQAKITLAWSYHAYGDRLTEQGKKKEAFAYYTKAYQTGSSYTIDIPAAYVYKLLEYNEVEKAEGIIEKFRNKFESEKLKNLILNVSWKYFFLGDGSLKLGEKDKAYEYYKKANQRGMKYDKNIPGSYLYKLMELERLDEAEKVLGEAKKIYRQNQFYEQEFWIIHKTGLAAIEAGENKKAIRYLCSLFSHAMTEDKIWQDDTTYSQLAFLNIKHVLYEVITVVPYWIKYNPEENKEAREYLRLFKKQVPGQIAFVYDDLLGAVLYRENKLDEAKATLDRYYSKLVTSSYLRHKQITVTIPFPLKGRYYAGGNGSTKAITHMGAHTYCYDIFGSDSEGRVIKEGRDGTKNSDYYGYGDLIYSPVDGVVVDVVDGNEDAPPSSTVQGDGNHLVIESGGLLYNFVHLKQNSITLKKGDKVKKGQVIARLGNSASTVAHLHFGVYSKDWLVSYPVYFTDYEVVTEGQKKRVSSGRPGAEDRFEVIIADW